MSANEIKNRTVYMLCRTDKPNDGTDIYIGSMSLPLWRRLCCHRSNTKKFIERGCSRDNHLYKRMNEVGIRNWEVIPLLMFACDQYTIFEFEREWIRVLKTDLNMISPIREEATVEEYNANWYRANKNTVLQWYKNNIEDK